MSFVSNVLRRVVFVFLCSLLLVLTACSTPPPEEKVTPPATEPGCEKTTLLKTNTDPSKPGPWKVGTRTIQLAGMTTEVLYPAAPGSEKDKTKERFDLRKHLPKTEQKKISEEDNPWQECDCYRALPVDKERGPYPVILFIHGTAGFRTQSLAHMTHWASRGFVVIAADHPGLMLQDALELKFAPSPDLQGQKLLAAIRSKASSLGFVAKQMDVTRLAVVGHSAGGNAAAQLGAEKGVRVVIPMAASAGVKAGDSPVSSLILGGVDDKVVAWDKQQASFEKTAPAKRLLGLKKAGHLAFSDLCVIGRGKGGLLQIAIQSGVTIPEFLKGMIDTLATDGCKEGQLKAEDGWKVIHHVSSAVLEETLHCKPKRADSLSSLQAKYPSIVEGYKEVLK